jgi:trk system potassium uptake protein TrkA
MNVIIIGGGQTGVYVANLLLANHCRVKVMESRRSVLTKLKDEIPADCIYEGSGTDPNVLEAAGINTCDVLVCATGADETNLVASTIGKFEFNVPRVIARVNNPHNAWMFNAGMGVDVTVNQADLMGHIILEGIDMRDMTTLLKLERGNSSIVQIHVSDTSSVNGKQIKELAIPEEAIIISIMRGTENIVAKGDTVIHAGDELLALADETTQPKLNKIFHS